MIRWLASVPRFPNAWGAEPVRTGITARLQDIAPERWTRPQASGFVVITDARLRGAWVRPWLAHAGLKAPVLMLPRGERAKTPQAVLGLCSALVRRGVDRHVVLIAVGGGALSDAVGLAAGLLHRGVRWAAAPTTLLAQTDAATGGKTAMNLPAGKNLLGLFHAPQWVAMPQDVLASLPVARRLEGLAEAAKMAITLDARLLAFMESHARALAAGEPRSTRAVIAACVRLKAAVVTGDPWDMGGRMVLNFGHTVGHALEHGSRGRLRHGIAVALGMRLEARLGVRLGLVPPALASRLEALLTALGLPARVPAPLWRRARGAIFVDKKRKSGKLCLPLPAAPGIWRLHEIPVSHLESNWIFEP